jgi:transposase InsO family protein
MGRNDIWSMDFVADELADGRRFRTLAAMDLRAYTNGVILGFGRRGKPTDNATIESLNGRFRAECLNVDWFASLEDAQQKTGTILQS